MIKIDEPCKGIQEFQKICEGLLSGFEGKKVIQLRNDHSFSIHDKKPTKPIDPNDAKMQELMGRFLANNISYLAKLDRPLQAKLCLKCTRPVFNALDASIQATTEREAFFSEMGPF